MPKRFNARQFPAVYEELDINIGDLGCIMLDLEPLPVTELVPNGKDDLHYSKIMKYGQGAVAEGTAHVTLLYGLLRPGSEWADFVDTVLDDWSMDSIEIDHVGFFPASVDEDYTVIVGHVKVTDELLEGHERLSLLPHVDTFPGYKAHVTLAYVKGGVDIRDKWITALNKEYAGRTFPIKALNYGD